MTHEYTENIHADRLITFLERSPEVCQTCPAGDRDWEAFGKYFKEDQLCAVTCDFTRFFTHKCCVVCKDFLNLDADASCPCGALGENEAVKASWLALEEKGYLP